MPTDITSTLDLNAVLALVTQLVPLGIAPVGFIAVVIIALVEAIKRVFPDLSVQFYPPVTWVAACAVIAGVEKAQNITINPYAVIVVGLLFSLVSSGLYSQSRTLVPKLQTLKLFEPKK